MDSYSAGFSAAMDRHAPAVTRCVIHHRSAPWLTDERGTQRKTTGKASLGVKSPDCPQENLRQGVGHREEMQAGRQET